MATTVFEALRRYKSDGESAKEFARKIKQKEREYRQESKSQIPSAEDRLRCYNL